MDIKLNYREQGDGYPLILLHGNGEDSSCFRHQLEFFSKEYRVIAIDTRGQGESPRGTAPFTFEQFAQDLEDFMDEHGIFRANILGFSDGGITALIFALTRPERVNKLILNGANLDPEGVVEPLRTKIQEKREGRLRRLRTKVPKTCSVMKTCALWQSSPLSIRRSFPRSRLPLWLLWARRI